MRRSGCLAIAIAPLVLLLALAAPLALAEGPENANEHGCWTARDCIEVTEHPYVENPKYQAYSFHNRCGGRIYLVTCFELLPREDGGYSIDANCRDAILFPDEKVNRFMKIRALHEAESGTLSYVQTQWPTHQYRYVYIGFSGTSGGPFYPNAKKCLHRADPRWARHLHFSDRPKDSDIVQ